MTDENGTESNENKDANRSTNAFLGHRGAVGQRARDEEAVVH